MKVSLFVLGFLTGTLATYLILTQWWWPDVRLEAAHSVARAVVSASPGATAPVTPLASPTTEASETWNAPLTISTPPTPEALPTPGAGATPPLPTSPPVENRVVQLPILKSDLDVLRERSLIVPVQGTSGKALRDTFSDDRGGRRHQALDIMAPRGTPVLATDDGRVEKLFNSARGGLTLYQFDERGEYCYYYAHLDRYAEGLQQGALLRRGDVIGYVGSTGNASPDAPHLHFTIFRLGSDKRWWAGTAINAYPLLAAASERR